MLYRCAIPGTAIFRRKGGQQRMILKRYVGDRPFYKKILRVMLPIVAQQGITSFVSLLDNIMVGRVGTEQMSGVAISNQLLFIFQLALFGGLSGAGIFCAQYYGKGDREKVQSVFRFKVISITLITAVAVTVYLLFGPRLISLFLTDTGNPEGIAETLAHGSRYMRIMLIGQIPLALAMIYATTMRETGETVIPMGAGITAVVVNMESSDCPGWEWRAPQWRRCCRVSWNWRFCCSSPYDGGNASPISPESGVRSACHAPWPGRSSKKGHRSCSTSCCSL